MLNLDSLSFAPAGPSVLQEVSLEVQPGEIVTLLGPSGSGKTTLLRMVSGLEVPDKGSVSFEGELLTKGRNRLVPAAKRPFAFLFQDFTLFPHLTVRRNIELGIRKQPKAERRERVGELAELLGITDLLKRPIHRLSGGEQQRVALARTLVIRPKVLMLDEPFSNLDPMTQQRLSRDVKRIAKELELTVLLSSHNREEAFFFSDRLVVLSKGVKSAEGIPAEIYRHPQTEWLARFTGETVICSAEQLANRFGHTPTPVSERYLVRPEDISLAPASGTASDCEVSRVEFYGTTSKVYVTDSRGDAFHATLLGPTDFQKGEMVSLSLVQDPFPLSA